MSTALEAILKISEMNMNLVADGREELANTVLLRQHVGYLIDAAESTDTGEYVVPGEEIERLRAILSGKSVPA